MAFFNETLTNSEILDLINRTHYSTEMANYLFIRLLYPSYFFNLYDKYIEDKKVNNNMINYIKKSKEYESLLLNIYHRLSINNEIKINLWLFKSQH